jgi:DNA adenine methylase
VGAICWQAGKEAVDVPRRSVLRYLGGKQQCAGWIVRHLPPHRVYVESYAGAASVLMAKPRSYAEVLNDVDEEIVGLFRVLRDRTDSAELERRLRLTPYALREWELAYEPAADPIECARRLIVRAFQGHGSGATNREFRTSFRARPWRNHTPATNDWRTYPDALRGFTERLQGVLLECQPAAQVLRRHDEPDTLVYADPPYPHAVRSQHASCRYRHEMTDDDHRELAEVLRGVKGMVVLSGYHCPLYDELFGDWERVERATLADGAHPRVEVLWLNAAAWSRQRQQSLFDSVPE